MKLVRAVFPRQSPYRAPVNDLWPVYAKYLPHVLSLCKTYSTFQKPFKPLLRFAELLSDAGNYMWERGLLKDAFEMLATAELICDQALDPDDPNPIRSSVLAVTASFELNQSGSLRQSGLAHKERVLDLRTKYMTSKPEAEINKFDGLLLGSAYNNLACAYMQCEDFERAETALLRSLEIKMQWSSEADTPFPFAEGYKNMGLVRLSQGRTEEALRLVKRASEMMVAWKGARTKSAQFFQFIWAMVLANCGDRQGALARHFEILQVQREILGELAIQTLDSYFAIGALHHGLGQLEEAE